MASFNITVEDSSPLISYSNGAWIDSPATDTLLSNYSASSFHTTSVANATASIRWNGTGIWVFGALRPDHGDFQASLDGGPATTFNGFSQTPRTQINIVHAENVPMGQHELLLVNTPQAGQQTGFDIDFVLIQTEINTASPTTINVDDADDHISYLPDSSDWTTNNQKFFLNGTSHVTQTPGASFSVVFTGQAVAVYGSMTQAHAPYDVTVDGETTSYIPNVSQPHQSTILYLGSNLVGNGHQLTITHRGQANQYLDLDYLQVFTTLGSAGVAEPPAQDSSAASSVPKLTAPEIAGIVVGAGGFILICILGLIVYTLMRRKRRRDAIRAPLPVSPMEMTLPIAQRFTSEKSDTLRSAQSPRRPATRPASLGDVMDLEGMNTVQRVRR